ncbi:MAG: radical SAM protein [Gammaproteobacteria bacterium]
MRLLLINPRFPESFWSFRWALENILPHKRAINPPLGLATLAALCPPAWQVEIIDENIEPVPLDPQADIVGICGMAAQFPRQRELIEYYRRRGHYVVAGGSFASLCPERYSGLADTVVAGEAEYIWPAFCREFEHGAPKTLYQENGVVNLEDSPTPRFDLLKLNRYNSVSMQFSRGCPYRCEFCDIIVMFGRRPRTKRVEQIGRELDVLRAHGVHDVFFVDDNLIGNKKLAKALLRYIDEYQQRHDYVFRFGTEASINVADDPALLRLLTAANFTWVFIGIESPDEGSLQEANKDQNTGRDLLTAVRTLYQNGIDVLAGFIIGFDNDNLDSFSAQYRFITDSGIQVSMVGLLTALPRTPLYGRLQREGRLIEGAAHGDNTKPDTNIIPKRMGREEMVRAYQALYQRLFTDDGIARRICNKAGYLKNPACAQRYGLREGLGNVRRLIMRGLLAGGPKRVFHFVRTLVACPPRVWQQVVQDWIVGLAMRDYIRRHFMTSLARERHLTQRTGAWIRKLFATEIRHGTVEIDTRLDEGGAALQIMLRGYTRRAFCMRTVRRLNKLLRRSATTVTLHIDSLAANQTRQLRRLLKRLAPYGDRVSIWIGERARPLAPTVDSSVFHLLLTVDGPACPRPRAGDVPVDATRS